MSKSIFLNFGSKRYYMEVLLSRMNVVYWQMKLLWALSIKTAISFEMEVGLSKNLVVFQF